MAPSRGWFTALDVPADLLDECHDAVRAVRSGSPVEGLHFVIGEMSLQKGDAAGAMRDFERVARAETIAPKSR